MTDPQAVAMTDQAREIAGSVESELQRLIAQAIYHAQEARKPQCTAASWPHSVGPGAGVYHLANSIEVMTAALSELSYQIKAVRAILQEQANAE